MLGHCELSLIKEDSGVSDPGAEVVVCESGVRVVWLSLANRVAVARPWSLN
jgi:hypothetical protein